MNYLHRIARLYERVVGYDPFEDDPTRDAAEVHDSLKGVLREFKAHGATYADIRRDCQTVKGKGKGQ